MRMSSACYVRQAFQAPAFTDAGPAMDSLYRTYETAVKADEAIATAAFRECRRHELLQRMARRPMVVSRRSWRPRRATPIWSIVGQAEPDAPPTATPSDLAETVAMAGERPVLIVPHIGVAKPPGKTVMLCWNGSREAARAATGALPLLKTADKVIVLLIDPKNDAGDEKPGADVARGSSVMA